jgi:hypothetical protein
MSTILIIFLFIVIAVLIYALVNITRYSERLEDVLSEYETKITDVREKIIETEIRLKELDIRGAFEADDEVGFAFKTIKELSTDLTKTMEYIYDERN